MVAPMITPPDDANLDYAALWAQMTLNAAQLPDITAQAATILAHRPRYAAVSLSTGVPWWWIGCLHMREASGDFTTHLHNGDKLTARTVHVPKHRPSPPAEPPFTWEVSAIDALSMPSLKRAQPWTIASALRHAEAYNGLGYQRRGLRSPYLWAGSNWQQPGKFGSDGVFLPTMTDRQIGVAPLMRALAGLGVTLA
jgi:lysozyme family protein